MKISVKHEMTNVFFLVGIELTESATLLQRDVVKVGNDF